MKAVKDGTLLAFTRTSLPKISPASSTKAVSADSPKQPVEYGRRKFNGKTRNDYTRSDLAILVHVFRLRNKVTFDREHLELWSMLMQQRWDPLPDVESDVVYRLLNNEMTIPEGRYIVHGPAAAELETAYQNPTWRAAVVKECEFLEELKKAEVQSWEEGVKPSKKKKKKQG